MAAHPSALVTGDPRASGPRRRAAVLGNPVAHSLSPVLHRAAYRALGLDDWRYETYEVDEQGIGSFLADLGGDWAGLSLTMPLKRAVMPLLDEVSVLATEVAAVNTVTFTADGRRIGTNTDVAGIVAALAEAGVGAVRHAAVIGAGATAGSALAALRALGCDAPRVYARSMVRARSLLETARRLGVNPELIPLDRVGSAMDSELMISTLPSGAGDQLVPLCLPGARTRGDLPALLDVVYAPWPTVLSRAWQDNGGHVVGGFAMLLHQAADQVWLMTGRPAPLTAMREAGTAELARRGLGGA